MFCPKCTAIVPDGSKFCNKCSAPLTAEAAIQAEEKKSAACPKCGEPMELNSKVCKACAGDISVRISEKVKKLLLAGIVSIFLIGISSYIYNIGKREAINPNEANGQPIADSVAGSTAEAASSTQAEETFETDTDVADIPDSYSDEAANDESSYYSLTEEDTSEIIADADNAVPSALLTYYTDYLRAINLQDESYQTHVTPEQAVFGKK